jgi:hypothetical protein
LFSGLIIAVAVLGLGAFAYPSMPVLIAQTPTLTTTNESTYTNQHIIFSTFSSTTTAVSTSIESVECEVEIISGGRVPGAAGCLKIGWATAGYYTIFIPGCPTEGYNFTTSNYVRYCYQTYNTWLYNSTTTLWPVVSTTTSYELPSTTTFPSYYLTTNYHTNTVPPYAYYGLGGVSFAGVALVVLVLCGVLAFYATRVGKKRGQVKLTQFVSKKPTCGKCGATLPPDSKFCEKCGSAQD